MKGLPKLGALALVATALSGTPSLAASMTFGVAADGALVLPAGVDPARVVPLADGDLTLVFDCRAPADCTGLAVTLDGATQTFVSRTARVATLNLTLDPRRPTQALTISANGRTTTLQLAPSGTAPAGSGGGTPRSSALVDLLQACNDPNVALARVAAATNGGYVAYDARHDRASMIVSPAGAVYDRFDEFDESDELTVWVYGQADLVATLHLERSSAIRTPGQYLIVGDAETAKLDRHALGDDACALRSWRLRDFAPGKGTVQISRIDKEPRVALGTIEFVVNPLYSGIFSLGGVWTDLVDPELTVASNGTENVILAGQQGEDEFEYALFFTPFVWGKRDLEQPVREWYRRINPTIGVVFDDVEDNALIGLTVDLPQGVLLTWGRHFRRIDALDPASGLAVGDPFGGSAAELPLAAEWEDESYLGFSIDMRAAVKLFKNAFTTPGS